MGCCHDRTQKVEEDTDLATPHIFKRSNSILDNIKRQYKFLDKLNEGSYSVVYSAKSINSGELRAVKCIPIFGASNEKLHAFSEEIRILQELDHPNILKVLDVFKDRQYIYIVTEQCKGGELFDRILSNKNFTETQAAHYMLQMVSAVVYLHHKKIMHRDLKPENMMFETKDSESLLKLIDFGSSKHFTEGIPAKERLGSAYYIAPEVLNGNYDEKCDIWSLGVICHILLSGYPPFSGSSDQDIFTKVQLTEPNFNCKSWQKISKEAIFLIQSMLNKDPKLRPTASEVFQSPWLQNFRNNLLPAHTFSPKTFSNLSSFCVNSKLMKASLNFIAKHVMSSEEISDLRKIFEKIDANGDGILSPEEIKDALMYCPSEIALSVDLIVQKLQVNEGEGIKYSDFLIAAIDWTEELSKERLKKAFVEFDKDGNGSISVEELRKTLGGSEEQSHLFLQMIKEADFDGNGEIDLEEFCKFMLQAKLS